MGLFVGLACADGVARGESDVVEPFDVERLIADAREVLTKYVRPEHGNDQFNAAIDQVLSGDYAGAAKELDRLAVDEEVRQFTRMWAAFGLARLEMQSKAWTDSLRTLALARKLEPRGCLPGPDEIRKSDLTVRAIGVLSQTTEQERTSKVLSRALRGGHPVFKGLREVGDRAYLKTELLFLEAMIQDDADRPTKSRDYFMKLVRAGEEERSVDPWIVLILSSHFRQTSVVPTNEPGVRMQRLLGR